MFADYEGGLVGVQSSNTNLETSNFTYNLCVGMMFFDAVLYGVLAWYLDNVLPSEYGTQLPLYFPLLPSYWFGLSSISDTWYGALCGMCMRKQKYSIVGQDEGLETGLLSTHAAEQGAGAANAHKNEYIEPVAADLLRQAVTQTCLTISDLRKVSVCEMFIGSYSIIELHSHRMNLLTLRRCSLAQRAAVTVSPWTSSTCHSTRDKLPCC